MASKKASAASAKSGQFTSGGTAARSSKALGRAASKTSKKSASSKKVRSAKTVTGKRGSEEVIAAKSGAKRVAGRRTARAALPGLTVVGAVRRPRDRSETDAAAARADTVQQRALRRRAVEQLNRLAEMRDAVELADSGKGQREIAEALMTTQPRVHRLLKAAQISEVESVSAEEMIWLSAVGQMDRDTLVDALKSLNYTFRRHAPEPFDGAVSGSWDQVRAAALNGFLSRSEYEDVRDAVQPPT